MKTFLLILAVLWAGTAHSQESSGPRNALLSWTAPTQNTDGTPITVPLRYRVYRGNTLLIETSERSVLLTMQPLGRQCYAVTAVAGTAESDRSAEACKRMRPNAPSNGSIGQ